MTNARHIPVLLNEAMHFLDVEREGTYIDCTLGMAGHSLEILKRNPKARIIGLDLDERSLQLAKKNLLPHADRVRLNHSDFRYLPDLNLDYSEVRGVLIDLGISSYQLDSAERGFSHAEGGPIDMRMDLRNKLTARKIINKYSEFRLAEIFHKYGELRQARRLAREIVSRRRLKPIEDTLQLRRLVEEVCRWRAERGKIHPASKVFLSLRIEVNQELKDLDEFLGRVAKLMPVKCRIVIISFHSLEDRIAKQTFVSLSSDKECAPCLRILTKKPVTPGEKEIADNPRSRSAKLRAAETL
jgi:16S rRNA (cytosine1402-N4)-methyltransferase